MLLSALVTALVPPLWLCTLPPLLACRRHSPVPAAAQILWQTSIYLEALAMLPQLQIVARQPASVDNAACVYILLVGAYRGFYVINWVHRYLHEFRFFYPHGARRLCARFCSRTRVPHLLFASSFLLFVCSLLLTQERCVSATRTVRGRCNCSLTTQQSDQRLRLLAGVGP